MLLKHLSTFFVDNWLTGADTIEKACEMFEEATRILGDAGMPLNK